MSSWDLHVNVGRPVRVPRAYRSESPGATMEMGDWRRSSRSKVDVRRVAAAGVAAVRVASALVTVVRFEDYPALLMSAISSSAARRRFKGNCDRIGSGRKRICFLSWCGRGDSCPKAEREARP